MAERPKRRSSNDIAKLGTAPDAEIAQILGRSPKAVGLKPSELKIAARYKPGSKRPWSDDEIATLGTAPDAEIAQILGRSPDAVGLKRGELKTAVCKTGNADAANYFPPTSEEDERILEHIDAESRRVIEIARAVFRVTLEELFDLNVADVDLRRQVISVQGSHAREEKRGSATPLARCSGTLCPGGERNAATFAC